jgi:hypothetical protein
MLVVKIYPDASQYNKRYDKDNQFADYFFADCKLINEKITRYKQDVRRQGKG